MRPSSSLLLLLLAACASDRPAPLAAETELTRATREYLLDPGSLAVQGYDVVSYFPEGGGRPLPGKPELRVDQDGVVYQFASPEHRALFLAAPERFQPAYGGWCATAMAEGEKVEISPTNYLLSGGRLFLFYEGLLADALPPWKRDATALERAADRWWKRLSGEASPQP